MMMEGGGGEGETITDHLKEVARDGTRGDEGTS